MPFIYHTNRASAVFAAALGSQGGVAWQPGDPHIDLLYFDAWDGKRPPPGVSAGHALMDRRHTIPLDQKRLMASRLQQHGIAFPRQYFAPAEVPIEPDTLWYVKDPLSTGGRRIWLCRRSEVEAHFQSGYLIQEAVTDLALVEGRKFTLRSYVLVHANVVYLFPEGFLVLHAGPYDPASTDPELQVRHAGYMEPGGKVALLPTSEYRGYAALEPALTETVQRVFACFARELGPANPASSYCLFGLDVLHCSDNRVALVEINDRPNLLHTAHINSAVNQPMVQALAHTVLAGQGVAKPALRFEEVLSLPG